MGIQGLTTYIMKHSDRYLQYFELCDSYLVIDGNSLRYQLYNLYAKCNCAFGGDYDKYAQCVRIFFDSLAQCNVTPLVLFDGGYEKKKLKTAIARKREKIQAAASYNPTSQSGTKFVPLFTQDVFKAVMLEKGIKCVQCVFEADNTIAAVARVLECPVLSYDSDFFIYGALYIPFNTLERNVVRRRGQQGYMKRCKIYNVQTLLDAFQGLDRSSLPLAAILLGNDYVNRSTFNNFFHPLQPRGKRRKCSKQQHRIEATLRWLRRHSLDNAVLTIMSTLRKHKRKRVLHIIETIVECYNASPTNILLYLGFSTEYVNEATSRCKHTSYKFEGDIDKLIYIQNTSNVRETEIIEKNKEEEDGQDKGKSHNVHDRGNVDEDDQDANDDDDDADEDDDDDNNDPTDDDEDENQLGNKRKKETDAPLKEIRGRNHDPEVYGHDALFVNTLPAWFINNFILGKYPSYFIDVLVRKLYICSVQIEDYSYPSAIIISTDIIKVICRLLLPKTNENNNLRYMARGETSQMICYELNLADDTFDYPSLKDLATMPLTIRKEILDNVLCCTTNKNIVNDFPDEWTLYIATVIYWMKQECETLYLKCHIYTLIFFMLVHVIDTKIGYYRDVDKFRKKYEQRIKMIQCERKSFTCKSNNLLQHTVKEAYNSIDVDDCLLAAEYFISNSKIDSKLLESRKKFDVSIVHGFSQFQNCLYHAMHLNALLEYPYPQTNIANMFNGTLLYNLFRNLNKRKSKEAYIGTILINSPSLLQLFNMLLMKINSILPISNLLEKSKNSKHKKPKSKIDTDSNPSFCDLNNTFSLLPIEN